MKRNGRKSLAGALARAKNESGFTLVELIVVIAILGILAGVGTVGYSGYIKKANEAADKQLVAAINTAFSSACIENGIPHTSIANAEENWNGKAVDGIDSVSATGLSNEKANSIIAAFSKYYAGNESNEFKTVTSLSFYQGMFDLVDPSGKNLTQGQLAALARYNASNMRGKEEALANSANNLSNLFVSQYLGTGTNSVAKLASFMDDFDTFKSTYGLDENSSSTEVANATVLYVASKASAMNAGEIMTTIQTSTNAFGDMTSKYGALPTAALMYGVMTGYANSSYATAAFKETYATPPTGISDVASMFQVMYNEASTNGYFTATEKGVTADMDGYLGALELVNDYEDSFDITDANAFNNEETLTLLQNILGNT